MNKIKIKNLQKKVKINRQKLKALALKVLKHRDVDGVEVSILLVDDVLITQLNEKYLRRPYPTDVLAFRMADGEFSRLHPELLGDVIISLETARSRAREMKRTSIAEAQLYLVHGILHLLGYSDKTQKGFLSMQKIEKEILGGDA
ncbi:MAG: rRNA maturation RNase YbeY [Candidatus Omnitrophica bacterium]|nr:rRNA maturation RNase YbeY [Candidatus Omnitrophota bacterium]MBU4477695.1 rRNA maturation RNase YbeY [Candidatus Omnitrophota bacterium]MCG2703892.1 rRNA maturation RNase YbeY [Candidatus Omnitrophota bacterium]